MSERIPQDFIDDLIERADVVRLLENELKLKKQEKNTKPVVHFTMRKHLHLQSAQKKDFITALGVAPTELH